jgi:hypothetical protein
VLLPRQRLKLSRDAKDKMLHMLRCTENSQQSDVMGLGRVKTLLSTERSGLGERGGNPRSFFGLDYARIAAMSSWTPIMFMTRVRL